MIEVDDRAGRYWYLGIGIGIGIGFGLVRLIVHVGRGEQTDRCQVRPKLVPTTQRWMTDTSIGEFWRHLEQSAFASPKAESTPATLGKFQRTTGPKGATTHRKADHIRLLHSQIVRPTPRGPQPTLVLIFA